MPLADYSPQREEVAFTGGSFIVRGLSLDDISLLMQNHAQDLDKLIAIYSAGIKGDAAVAAFAQYTIALAKEAPGLVGNLIAIASDEPDVVDKARALSMPTQVAALKVIGRLTFAEAGGPKKLFESLSELVRMVAPNQTMTGSRT
jgi:hypothetical protein